MKLIPLTQGVFAKIDDEDYEDVSSYCWCLSNGYAATWTGTHFMRMHRYILQYDGEQDIDHVNNDGLDNQKSNLRIVTRTQNNFNRKKAPKNIKTRELSDGRLVYDARVQISSKSIHLGTFRTERRAKVFIRKAIEHVIEGKNYVIGLKRPHRWGQIEQVIIDI